LPEAALPTAVFVMKLTLREGTSRRPNPKSPEQNV
jgi:hypothetical protein